MHTKVKKSLWQWALLVILAVIIRLISSNKQWVEDNYSSGIYPVAGVFFRTVFGWLPFSLGDLIYTAVVLWVIYDIVWLLVKVYRKEYNIQHVKSGLFKYLGLMLLVYIMFNLFWGLNYNRKGIAHQLALNVEEVKLEELRWLADTLLKKTNALQQGNTLLLKAPDKMIFKKTVAVYGNLKQDFPFLQYSAPSIKPSMFGVLGNYMGYMGYYNPFTGEAQVNTTVPRWTLPFVACHEVAHQLGYAKENEANFVGYLAAKQSGDTAFLYSVYFDLFLYANTELFIKDSATARANLKRLADGVKKDLKELRDFQRRYENPLDKVVDVFYNNFLKLNEQPAGNRTYNKVVLWLMAYYKKYGEL
jgi:hypothetical protein